MLAVAGVLRYPRRKFPQTQQLCPRPDNIRPHVSALYLAYRGGLLHQTRSLASLTLSRLVSPTGRRSCLTRLHLQCFDAVSSGSQHTCLGYQDDRQEVCLIQASLYNVRRLIILSANCSQRGQSEYRAVSCNNQQAATV